jgi:hypothetical protein
MVRGFDGLLACILNLSLCVFFISNAGRKKNITPVSNTLKYTKLHILASTAYLYPVHTKLHTKKWGDIW